MNNDQTISASQTGPKFKAGAYFICTSSFCPPLPSQSLPKERRPIDWNPFTRGQEYQIVLGGNDAVNCGGNAMYLTAEEIRKHGYVVGTEAEAQVETAKIRKIDAVAEVKSLMRRAGLTVADLS